MQTITPPSRISTGVPGCDDILGGGLIAGNAYLLAGSPGAGKTIFSLQWLRDGVRRGEKCMYITLCEPGNIIAKNVAAFGWNLNEVDIVDLSPSGEALGENAGEYHMLFARSRLIGL